MKRCLFGIGARVGLMACALLLALAPDQAIGQGCVSWTQVDTPTAPPPRAGPAMAFDTIRGRIVLFGGGGLRDTWEWDGSVWSFRSNRGPAPRSGHAMVFDAARGRTVMYGGSGLDDTWTWDGVAWTKLDVSGPGPRDGLAMAYDPVRRRTVLFGGGGKHDTWELDGASWSRAADNGPASDQNCLMAFDGASGHVLLFEGPTGQTWAWDGTTWSHISGGPTARGATAMAYDEGRGAMVLFGGISPATSRAGPKITQQSRWSAPTFFADSWEWDGGSWAPNPIPGPHGRYGAAMAYDSERGKVVLFGGEYFQGDWSIYPDQYGRDGHWVTTNETWELGGDMAITAQPKSRSVSAGDAAGFAVSASGTGLTYQWRRNGANLSDSRRISGATEDALYITSVETGDAGNYDVVISGPCGAIASARAGLIVSSPLGAALGRRIRAAADTRGASNAAYFRADGKPMLLTQPPGSEAWFVSELDSGLPAAPSAQDLLTWVDPLDEDTYVAILTPAALFVMNLSSPMGEDPDVTARVPDATPIVDDATVFASTDGLIHLAGLDPSGDLVLYTRTGEHAPRDWAFTNLTKDHFAAQGLPMPDFAGGLISYVTYWNGLNIAGLDDRGHIITVWWSPGMDLWRADDISAITGAPELSGGLTAYVTPWGGINLAGIDRSGSIVTTWWVPSFGGNWATSDLTALFQGPQLAADSIASYVTPWGGLNIAGTTEDGSVAIYWWAPGMDNWLVSTVNSAAPSDSTPRGPVTAVAAPTGEISLFGVGGSGNVVRYHWNPGSTWGFEDLSKSAVKR